MRERQVEEKKRESDEMGRVRLCRKTPLFVSLLLLFLSAAYTVYTGMSKVKAAAASIGVQTDY